MSTALRSAIPERPIDIAEVAQLVPTIRQSTLSAFDDCSLSTLFTLRHGQLWSTHPQARGTIMHRALAEVLRTMRRQGENSIPVSEGLQILYETLRQRDVPDEEVVRTPLRQIREMRSFMAKFCADNSFDVDNIIDIERRLSATVAYPHPETGEAVERTLTGQLDLLMAEPPQGALVIDWKDTWGLPPDHSSKAREGEEDDGSGLSYHGYFQQRFYAWLVMKNYPAVQRVTLREFYIRKSAPRPATVSRDRLHHIEQEMALLAEAFDRAFAWGPPPTPYRLETMGPWMPSPGKHCSFCLKKGQCPIDDEARGEGAIASEAMARRYAAEFVLTTNIREDRMKALKAYCEAHGPIEVKSAKGRYVIGWKVQKGGGRRFGAFVPEESDRGPKPDPHEMDKMLEEAVRESAARARAARPKRPRARNGGRRAA